MKDNTVNIIGDVLRKPYTAPCIETLRMDLSGFICESGSSSGSDGGDWGSDYDGSGTISKGDDGSGSTQPSGPWVDKDPDDQDYAD